MRVTMVSTRCQPEIGGIESHVAEVATRLVADGVDLRVLTTDRSGELAKVERVDGYVVQRYRAFPRSRDYYLAPGIFFALLRRRADLVHIQGVHTLVPPLAMLACILRRTPFVLTFHTGGSSSALRQKARGPQFAILAPLLRRAARLIGVSVFEADRFDDVLGEKGRVMVIRNGGSLPTPPVPPPVEPGLVISTGRLEHYKGHHRAVEALPELIRTHPEARLEILGSGPYEAELVALAERLGVADRVTIRFVPPVDRMQMAEVVASAGVMVLLSDYEAHPVAIMEALTLGRPVVVSRTSGLTEIATMGWALGIAPDASPSETAAAIAAQMDDPVVPAAADLPTWETCVAALEGVYAAVPELT